MMASPSRAGRHSTLVEILTTARKSQMMTMTRRRSPSPVNHSICPVQSLVKEANLKLRDKKSTTNHLILQSMLMIQKKSNLRRRKIA
jgi:hypothetical protein